MPRPQDRDAVPGILSGVAHLILGVGILLRLAGTPVGLPNLYHADERLYIHDGIAGSACSGRGGQIPPRERSVRGFLWMTHPSHSLPWPSCCSILRDLASEGLRASLDPWAPTGVRILMRYSLLARLRPGLDWTGRDLQSFPYPIEPPQGLDYSAGPDGQPVAPEDDQSGDVDELGPDRLQTAVNPMTAQHDTLSGNAGSLYVPPDQRICYWFHWE